MKKEIVFDHRALKDFDKLPDKTKDELGGLIAKIEEEGKLNEPYAKKLRGYKNLYEMRTKTEGQFRAFYAYLIKNQIIILNIFKKKAQKTPVKEIVVALNRLKSYEQ